MKVHTLHVVGLHLMIAAAKCQLSVEEEDEEEEDQLFGETLCSAKNWLTPVITLYVCSFVKVSDDAMKHTLTCVCIMHPVGYGGYHPFSLCVYSYFVE